MAEQKIQLRKVRDFGENFNDTFSLIRQEFKPLVSSFVLIAGIFILINATLVGITQKNAFSFLDELKSEQISGENSFGSIFTGAYFLTLMFTLITITAMRTVIAVYMKYRADDGEPPTVSRVWSGFIKYFPKTVLFSIPQYLLILVGIVFCFFPGVYLMIVFAPFVFVVVSEESSFSDVFSRCFDIIKENFWQSFAIYLVAYIIYSISSSIVGLIVGVIIGAASYLSTKELSSSAGLLMAVVSIVQYFFYIIFFVSVGLNYYSLVESRDGTGLAQRLENLGGDINPNANIEEQY